MTPVSIGTVSPPVASTSAGPKEASATHVPVASARSGPKEEHASSRPQRSSYQRARARRVQPSKHKAHPAA
eukprot:CAMPEP_0171254028 /NCGR_PEP_ID=MMETSP0790-20130122/52012_1 /TAXON_ID=2925 /ORGANISM="Alexandrium catenella, Strain OF101" /LENGTH=70 /DNA_ID=CAMNT_0011721881 /DNA_START=50 /DNA_END=259 /DNA_ORIENTATION=-